MATWDTQELSKPIVENKAFLNIGAGFNLLVATGFKLIIQPISAGTVWTAQTQN